MQEITLEQLPKAISLPIDIQIPGIDINAGQKRYNSEAAYLDVLRAYHIHTPPLLEKLRALANERTKTSLSEYTVVVHGLKGSSYGICADVVGREAEALEKAARVGDIERVLAGTMPFIENTELLLAGLGELLRTVAASKGAKQTALSPDAAELEQLLDAARQYKTSAMEAIIAGLESREYATGGELVAWLREQMDNLEYDAIRERLKSREVTGSI